MDSFAIFDENFYLSNYPDVAAAVIAGSFSSGLQHFQLYGLADNRFLVSPNYNETIYLQRYPDVAAAVAAGVAAGDSVLVYPILSFMGMLTVALEILCSEEILSSQTGRGTREGENTPPDASSEENPQDFNTPGSGGVNEWEQNFDGPWAATADIQFLNGQITQTIPLQISDDEAFIARARHCAEA